MHSPQGGLEVVLYSDNTADEQAVSESAYQ